MSDLVTIIRTGSIAKIIKNMFAKSETFFKNFSEKVKGKAIICFFHFEVQNFVATKYGTILSFSSKLSINFSSLNAPCAFSSNRLLFTKPSTSKISWMADKKLQFSVISRCMIVSSLTALFAV